MKRFRASWLAQGLPMHWEFKARDMKAAREIAARVVLAKCKVEEVKR